MWSVLRVNLSNPVSSVGNESFTACKKTLHLCVRGAGRNILVSARLGPRMESGVNMNGQGHDNMSATPRQNDVGKWMF